MRWPGSSPVSAIPGTEHGRERTEHRRAAALEYVGVNLGRADVRMAQLFLDGADVHAALQQVGREGVAGCGSSRVSRCRP